MLYLCRLFIFKKGSMQKNEIILYQSEDALVQLNVLVENETIWLSQAQIGILFGVQKAAISKHLKNIFASGELQPEAVVSILETTASDGKHYATKFYNLDAVLSIGYRVNSISATHFRIWANHVLKEYILRGAAIHPRIDRIEERLAKNELGLQSVNQKIETLVRTALPPTQGVFYDGQIFDAYVFAAELIKTTKESIVLIDNYIDESVLLLLSKRKADVSARILTRHISQVLATDLSRHNQQYPPITIEESPRYHDRFLIVDGTVYHIGASLKDLGKKLFAFSKMEVPPEWIGV